MSLSLNDIVFVPSVQHTGTWFTINFLKNFFVRNKELTFLLEDDLKGGTADVNREPKRDHPLDASTIVHIHFPIARYVNFDVGIPQSAFERRWIANLATRRSVPLDTILHMCDFFKTVIPIRDPFAAILSREARHPQFRHFFIVDNFISLATELSNHPNVIFLPIDLTDDITIRHTKLVKVLQHLEIDEAGHGELLNDISVRWPVSNITPNNRFKKLYEAGDVEEIRRLLGPKWAEVEYLKNMASVIMPFMSGLGYTRDRIYRGL